MVPHVATKPQVLMAPKIRVGQVSLEEVVAALAFFNNLRQNTAKIKDDNPRVAHIAQRNKARINSNLVTSLGGCNHTGTNVLDPPDPAKPSRTASGNGRG